MPEGGPGNTIAEAVEWVAGISGPDHVIDDQTAITVVDGTVDDSERQRELLTASRRR